MVTAAVLVALALGAGACGGDDDELAAAKNGSSGPPVKIMIINPIDNPIIDWKMSNTAALAAAEAINKDGGIGGRPIQVLTCNERVDPNQAARCARKAVSEQVTAVYMNSLFSSQILPILEKADIAAVGSLVTENIDIQAPNAFPIVPGTNLLNGAWPGVLKNAGKARIAGVVAGRASTATDVKVMQQGAQASGAGFVGAVGIPETQTDYSAPVQQIENKGADAQIVLLSVGMAVQLLKTANDLGFETTWASNSYTLFPSSFKTLGPVAEGVRTLDPLPPSTATDEYEGVRQFNDEMDAAGANGDDDRALPGMQAWLAVHAIAMLGNKVEGNLTSESLLAELNKGATVKLFDILDWTPGGQGPGEYKRLSNGQLFESVLENGELKAVQSVNGFELLGLE